MSCSGWCVSPVWSKPDFSSLIWKYCAMSGRTPEGVISVYFSGKQTNIRTTCSLFNMRKLLIGRGATRPTCHSEPVHVVEQVDVTEDEDGQQRPCFWHPAGRLLLRSRSHSPAPLFHWTLRLTLIWEERCQIWCGLAQRHGCRWGWRWLLHTYRHMKGGGGWSTCPFWPLTPECPVVFLCQGPSRTFIIINHNKWPAASQFITWHLLPWRAELRGRQ